MVPERSKFVKSKKILICVCKGFVFFKTYGQGKKSVFLCDLLGHAVLWGNGGQLSEGALRKSSELWQSMGCFRDTAFREPRRAGVCQAGDFGVSLYLG